MKYPSLRDLANQAALFGYRLVPENRIAQIGSQYTVEHDTPEGYLFEYQAEVIGRQIAIDLRDRKLITISRRPYNPQDPEFPFGFTAISATVEIIR